MDRDKFEEWLAKSKKEREDTEVARGRYLVDAIVEAIAVRHDPPNDTDYREAMIRLSRVFDECVRDVLSDENVRRESDGY